MKPTKCDPVNIFDAINNWENNTWTNLIHRDFGMSGR